MAGKRCKFVINTGNILQLSPPHYADTRHQLFSSLLRVYELNKSNLPFVSLNRVLAVNRRADVSITAKVFINGRHADVRDALDNLLAVLLTHRIDEVSLAFHPNGSALRQVPGHSHLAPADMLLLRKYCKQLERFVAGGRVASYGLADVTGMNLKFVHSKAGVKPRSLHLHRAYATAVPAGASAVCRETGVDLRLHCDPEVVCEEMMFRCLGWATIRPVWTVRYQIKRRTNSKLLALGFLCGIDYP